jgi:CubicO group peptidase (beta-lactamase class C family)
MDNIKLSAAEFLIDSHSDAVAVGIIDFSDHTFNSFELLDGDIRRPGKDGIYFDLASLTKPLTNSFVHIAENIKDKNLELLLNHRAGIPSWGLLSTSNWKEQILSYDIKESETLYSDYSANRYMLEVEKLTGKEYKDLVFKNFRGHIIHWLDLPASKLTLQNGYYHKKPNIGKVHDPNAFNIKEFMSHAGLFGTIDGVCRALVEFDRVHQLIDKMNQDCEHRFLNGFDRVLDPNNTLAGKGCGKRTFGHLGFTGTSFWVDPEKKLGQVILTNATKYYWYDKKELNEFRKIVGEEVWSSSVR